MSQKNISDIFGNLHLNRFMQRGLSLIPPVTIRSETSEGDLGENCYEFLLAEPYSTITGYFLENKYREIVPVDSESGLFLPTIKIAERTRTKDLIKIIEKDGVVIPSDGRIITGSSENGERPLILFSIACFSLFVKFFHIILSKKREKTITIRDLDYIDKVRRYEYNYTPSTGSSIRGNGDVPLTIESTGKFMVSGKLVDSIFGNISFRNGEDIYISESGSFLDDLDGHIVKVPLTGSIECDRQPSSEIEVHRNIYSATNKKTVIHGHPLFTVILSLDCFSPDCDTLGNIPVVPGETGDGRYRIENSVPNVIHKSGSVIVRGHGIFCSGNTDFSQPLNRMVDIENYCREEYFRRLV
ncbi:MAG: class II aldolase/adducin family protein [Candidatus Aminicenantes bacterium]|nr:class II aldolase/adducin family protein [Candidatus Aminicenantes bacterium]